ncbi:MAG: dCTP deaminase [Nanoarchaeota archaeon]|nr:dCTP deaminase [Nanoarchaeota archaeon]
MTVLGRTEILKLVREGTVKIAPVFKEANVGPASIDLTLANEFRVFKKGKALEAKEDVKVDSYTRLVKAGKITLKPGDFVHGITVEKITLPETICGLLHGRSKYARMGIVVHATASFIQPGVSNKQVLEIKNISPRSVVLKAGTRLCQLILLDMLGKGKYSGSFKIQEGL